MICFLLAKQELTSELEKEMVALKISYSILDPGDRYLLTKLYQKDTHIKALVCAGQIKQLPQRALIDLLRSIAKDIPVIIASTKAESEGIVDLIDKQNISLLLEPDAADIISMLDILGILGVRHKIVKREKIDLYNPMVATHLLKNNKSLSVLTIHSSEFRKIALEYGLEAYQQLRNCFQELLVQIWGTKGSFRGRDMLCRVNEESNNFVILLEDSRSEKKVPPPGALEKLAERVVARLQYLLWEEVVKPAGQSRLPDTMIRPPKFSIGYATVLFNPCVNTSETIESLFEASTETAKIQASRIILRQKEFVQALIQTEGMMIPFYQGVFYAKTIKEEDVIQANKTNSVRPLADQIYAFESLIRINSKLVQNIIAADGPVYIDASLLRPDVIFSMASSVKLSLELDQACLVKATQHFDSLPGRLLVNILPRNFYYVEKFEQLISAPGLQITFEVSEAEAISNFDLLLQAKEKLRKKNFGIAIDDFGKGFAGLDRAIKIKPDIIKLDRSLISDIDKDEPKRAFVTGLVNAAKISKSIILAEGVERIEEMKVLQSIGVDLFQGYLFHRPQSAASLKESLSDVLANLDKTLPAAS